MAVTQRVSVDEMNLSADTPLPITIASGDVIDIGAKDDAAVTDPTAEASVIAAEKGLLTLIGTLAASAVVDPTASASINALLKGIMTDIGPVAAAAVSDPTASASLVAALKGLLTQIGILTSAAVIDPTASGNVNALLKGLLKQLQGDGSGYAPVSLATALSSSLDSVNVDKMSKGSITVAHNAITATTTSSEIDCRGFNTISVECAVSSITSGNWICKVLGCAISGGTFGQCFAPRDDGGFEPQQTPVLAANGNTTYYFRGVSNYVEIYAERDTDGTLTCKVTPMNL